MKWTSTDSVENSNYRRSWQNLVFFLALGLAMSIGIAACSSFLSMDPSRSIRLPQARALSVIADATGLQVDSLDEASGYEHSHLGWTTLSVGATHGRSTLHYQEYRAGLPLRSFGGYILYEGAAETRFGVIVMRRRSGQGDFWVLPVAPIAIGLAADSVLYALAAIVIRRIALLLCWYYRKRRSYCMRCAYSLRGHACADRKCPECGCSQPNLRSIIILRRP